MSSQNLVLSKSGGSAIPVSDTAVRAPRSARQDPVDTKFTDVILAAASPVPKLQSPLEPISPMFSTLTARWDKNAAGGVSTPLRSRSADHDVLYRPLAELGVEPVHETAGAVAEHRYRLW